MNSLTSTAARVVPVGTSAAAGKSSRGRTPLAVRAEEGANKPWVSFPKGLKYKGPSGSVSLYPEGLPNLPGESPYGSDFSTTLWPNWKRDVMKGKSDEDLKFIVDSELIHGRWAMLGVAGAWGAEVGTGIPWFKAGALCTPSDCTAMSSIFPGQVINLAPEGSGFPSFYNVVAVEVLAIGLAEGLRWGKDEFAWLKEEWGLEADDNHPGGEHFDPLGLADRFDLDEMKVAEIKHARLAMLSWLGFMSQAVATNCDNAFGFGPNDVLPSYIDGAVGPYANWQAHIANPVAENVFKYIGLDSTAGLL